MHLRRPRPAPRAVSVDTDQEQFDLKCVRYLHTERARVGCGDPKCALETCAVARHSRLIVRALDALEGRRTGPVPKAP